MSTKTSPRDNSELCHGNLIEYRAFLRRPDPSLSIGIVILIASCQFDNPDMTLFFDGYNLMQMPPPGIHPQYHAFYVASTTSKLELADPPNSITVTDAFGSHDVPVNDWNGLGG